MTGHWKSPLPLGELLIGEQSRWEVSQKNAHVRALNEERKEVDAMTREAPEYLHVFTIVDEFPVTEIDATMPPEKVDAELNEALDRAEKNLERL
jgi:hypothetical protein